MGTTSVFVTLSEHPEYNSKIQLVINLSPVVGFFNKPDMDLMAFPYAMFFMVNIFVYLINIMINLFILFLEID